MVLMLFDYENLTLLELAEIAADIARGEEYFNDGELAEFQSTVLRRLDDVSRLENTMRSKFRTNSEHHM